MSSRCRVVHSVMCVRVSIITLHRLRQAIQASSRREAHKRQRRGTSAKVRCTHRTCMPLLVHCAHGCMHACEFICKADVCYLLPRNMDYALSALHVVPCMHMNALDPCDHSCTRKYDARTMRACPTCCLLNPCDHALACMAHAVISAHYGAM